MRGKGRDDGQTNRTKFTESNKVIRAHSVDCARLNSHPQRRGRKKNSPEGSGSERGMRHANKVM